MNINKTLFPTDTIKDVYGISMEQDHGLNVMILTLGACIQKVVVKNKRNGKKQEKILNLSFAALNAYENCQEYAGMTIGPNAGRIDDRTILIHGKQLNLTHNEGSFSLHGGFLNLSRKNWTITDIFLDKHSCSVTLQTSQENSIDGWPGNRLYQVCYTLTDTQQLKIDYYATTDQDTYINMTNHTYWNLTGNPAKALNQTLQIPANSVCINGKDHFPLRLRTFSSGSNDCFDFRNAKKISEALIADSLHEADKRQLVTSKGLNHGYLFDVPQCILNDPDSGISMCLSTDAPGVVVYSGGFIESGLPLSTDSDYSMPGCGIALEVQELPTVSSYTLTTPEKPYRRNITYHFIFPLN